MGWWDSSLTLNLNGDGFHNFVQCHLRGEWGTEWWAARWSGLGDWNFQWRQGRVGRRGGGEEWKKTVEEGGAWVI